MAAFALFGLLDAVRVAFNAPENLAGISRLAVTSRFSIIQPLPYAYLTRIRALHGVEEVAWANWFGGVYQDERNFFPNFAVSPRAFLDIHPELVLAPEQRQAFLATRTGAIVGAALAERFGWKGGDKIPLRATIFPKKNGDDVWSFDLVGIFRAAEPELRGMEQQMLFHYEFFDEGRQIGHGTVGWYIVKVDDPARVDAVAQRIDRLFANSTAETKSQSEREFQLSFAKQIGDIGLIVTAIMGAVFFALILLTGNTMAQALRDRIPEFAVLMAFGFTHRLILFIVLAESVLLLAAGGLGGMVAARLSLPLLNAASGGQFDMPFASQTWLSGTLLALVIGVAVGLPPALRALRLSIVDALAGR